MYNYSMPLIFITGISGTGKSTIRLELKRRGYDAYDVDEDNFRVWYNRSTDKKAAEQKGWTDTTNEWRKRYWLKVERSKVEEIAELAKTKGKPFFLCGTTPNDKDVWDLFDKVISLSISNEVLQQRLDDRTNNDYGKHPDDLKDILGWNNTIDEQMKSYGAMLVNAEQPLEKVVDEIIKLSI